MWSDTESDVDYLNFGEVSQLAVDVLKSPNMLPVSIGVFGNWGAGKSSLLKLIENDLKQSNQDWVVIQFDAWLYQGFDDARAALLEVIATHLQKEAEGNKGLIEKTQSLLGRVDRFRALGLLAEGAALVSGMPTGGLLSRGIGAVAGLSDGIQDEDEYKGLDKAAKEAKKELGGLLKAEKKSTPPKQIAEFRKEYGEILDGLNKPLVVVIDNLDRCLPSNAIHTLEAIRLFLFLPNTAFVVAADEGMIRSSVANHFKGASERHQIDYLDKLIQIPIRVPKAGVREIRSYLFMLYAVFHEVPKDKLETLRLELERSLKESWKEEAIPKQKALEFAGGDSDGALAMAYDRADRIAPILANSPIIHGNPRIVKRLLNVVRMRSQVAERRNMPIDEAVITKLVIFERCMGAEATADLYRMIDGEKGTPKLLQDLESGEDVTCPDSWNLSPVSKDFVVNWSSLPPSLGGMDLRAAIYLSRETMPIGSYADGLSPQAEELLKVLADVLNTSSPAATDAVAAIAPLEIVPVMEGLINNLRQITSWTKKPHGFAGACLLARRSPDAATILARFILSITRERMSPWMKTLLKDENWYKES
ncbi:KAP family P-loop NTPase fold protein [Teredinibacter purpureus]|uniref:KAP family P-loop NTPase fold protein n=1 Tax=Teredinibacter purpureus TaxID=2731756 RepID=UPI0005F8866E|nr:P-loop NTPase fold protein [Teredinibacter purpureus]